MPSDTFGCMGWLLREGDVLASLEVAGSAAARRRGLLGRESIDGALLLRPCRAVHTMGMRFAIDVAWCDRDLVVLRTARLRRHRVSRPVLRAGAVLEAQAGSFARWGLAVGDRLEIRDDEDPGS